MLQTLHMTVVNAKCLPFWLTSYFYLEHSLYNLPKNGVDVATVRQMYEDIFLDALFAWLVVVFEQFHSAQKDAWGEYLVHNITSQYHANDFDFRKTFKDGTGL